MTDLSDTAAIILAAGLSRRFGADNKLLSPFEGRPLIVSGLEILKRTGIDPVIVVTGRDADQLTRIIAAHGCRTVYNPLFEQGMGTSIAAGAKALRAVGRHVFVMPGDMPRIPVEIFGKLRERLESADDICRPQYNDAPGHPVLFGANHLAALANLSGEQGAHPIIAANIDKLVSIPTDEPGVIYDIDTPPT